jgi:hypothetical protein
VGEGLMACTRVERDTIFPMGISGFKEAELYLYRRKNESEGNKSFKNTIMA